MKFHSPCLQTVRMHFSRAGATIRHGKRTCVTYHFGPTKFEAFFMTVVSIFFSSLAKPIMKIREQRIFFFLDLNDLITFYFRRLLLNHMYIYLERKIYSLTIIGINFMQIDNKIFFT